MTLPASGAISLFDVNDELGLTHTAAIGLLCTNVRTLFGTASGAVGLETGYSKSNTSVPGAPTGVSASATSCSAISVSFTAPACTGHLTIDYYQAVCTATGTNSATGSSPISITGLSGSTSYTFKVRAHNSQGYGSYSSSTGTATTSTPTGSISFTSAGATTWVAPSGVNKISVLVIAAGARGAIGYYGCCCGQHYGAGGEGGRGGGLEYKNNISVTPGTSYIVQVGVNTGSFACRTQGDVSSWIGPSSCSSASFAIGRWCGHSYGDGGGTGGGGGGTCGYFISGGDRGGGGGGAGGYSGNGGCGATYTYGNDGAGGGGGGGGKGNANSGGGAGGGGVGIYGQGSSGSRNSGVGVGGGGGSSGSNGTSAPSGSTLTGASGGSYGGGGGGAGSAYGSSSTGGLGGLGVVRIVWPGNTRTFPTTCVGSP